jgi:hypothetical protein
VRACESCARPFAPKGSWQRLCWECWHRRRELDDQAFAAGYDAGYADGLGRRHRPTELDPALVGRIVRLTHPDRHPPERAVEANEVTAVLLNIREQIG